MQIGIRTIYVTFYQCKRTSRDYFVHFKNDENYKYLTPVFYKTINFEKYVQETKYILFE